jgi:arylsulfatase
MCNSRFSALGVLALGVLAGYAVATYDSKATSQRAAEQAALRIKASSDAGECAEGGCCSGALAKEVLLTLGDGKAQEAPPQGSPGATTTIDGKQLPPPDPKFGGVIKNDALQSKYWWAPRIVPPKQAPNILLIMTDDSGFGVPGTFGGVIPTPTMDRLAKSGLRYNNIHSTALCSPTRAALITGRNHHSAGFGVVSEQSTGFPGYNSIIAKDKATIGRILKDNGFATSWFGKAHNTPTYEASQVGPFDRWPTGMGFEYFYGFVGGDANQWQPNLFRNTTQIYPFQGKPGWNLVTGMADDAIDWLNRIDQIDPSKPFFCHYVPGATHAPHHPTKEREVARAYLRKSETPGRDSPGYQAGALAEGAYQALE